MAAVAASSPGDASGRHNGRKPTQRRVRRAAPSPRLPGYPMGSPGDARCVMGLLETARKRGSFEFSIPCGVPEARIPDSGTSARLIVSATRRMGSLAPHHLAHREHGRSSPRGNQHFGASTKAHLSSITAPVSAATLRLSRADAICCELRHSNSSNAAHHNHDVGRFSMVEP